ncbi:PepSY-associated TM helix domain-containing protein [Phenylobacterium sp.]|uniref:PepSY-associated TM helix domain-containing protein n=1 Tax=Phenylobacterium sp. TaxID=1871053 RepID=UPI00301C12BD
MTTGALRGWFLIHKWTSIVCTAFLLMLCVTGLPLIFHDEIDSFSEHHPAFARGGVASSGDDPALKSLDEMLAKALAARPGEVPLFMAFDNDRPLMTVTTGPSPDAPESRMTIQLFDRATGEAVGEEEPKGVMYVLLKLHTDMFLGLPGMLFLGVMGLLFVAAIVSGVVLYAPFMRKLPFGTVRASKSARVRWLDYHNLLGAVTLAWASVVGFTGVINTLATPIVQVWQLSELAEMTRAYDGRPALPPSRYGSLDRAMAAARVAMPDANPQFIGFPGGAFSSKHHYAVFFQGGTPLTERLLTPALIDGETGALTDVRPMPWYAQALLISQPLHFGDYGGLPLKILWAVLDVFTIVVLGSGLYLWLGKGPSTAGRVREIQAGAAAEEAVG